MPVAVATGSIAAQKLQQARDLLRECSLDAWLLAVRESKDRPDPNLQFFLEQDFTWNTYFLVTPKRTVALVATFDAPDVVSSGLFDEVLTYKEGARASLVKILEQADPKSIGINVSKDDPLSDGLTAGLRDEIQEALAETPYASRLVSAEPLLARLRGVKLPAETAAVQRAVDDTEAMFENLAREFRIGMTARQIGERFHREADRAGAPTAWARRHCPTVTVGARSPIGHVAPSEEPVTDGCLVHVDFGINRDGYCSDLQRLWWVRTEKGPLPPEPVREAYDTIVQSIDLAAKALKPGITGWEVDQKVRERLTSRGFPEYAHALGHHLGRAVHDGGGVLGPRWERYGRAPYETVREGNLYTLEPSIHLPAYGMVALEEDVTVELDGARFLSRFPRELSILTIR